jgi:hypothetical protein
MTLGWILNPKIKNGYLNEYKELIMKLTIVKDPIEIFKMKTRLKELIYYPHEIAECKKIGIDEEATEFYRKKLLSEYKDPKDIESSILSCHGKHIDSIVPEYNKNAIAKYTISEESCLHFNGGIIGYNYSLPFVIQNEAFLHHSSTEMIQYSNILDRFLYENEELNFVNIQIVQGAIEWLRFWGLKGFDFQVSS